eukprot:8125228-Karenia_brevis.AAC.1
MTTTPPSSGPGASSSGPGTFVEGDQHGSGAGRSDLLVLSPAGARGEIDLFGRANLMEATAATTRGGARQ